MSRRPMIWPPRPRPRQKRLGVPWRQRGRRIKFEKALLAKPRQNPWRKMRQTHRVVHKYMYIKSSKVGKQQHDWCVSALTFAATRDLLFEEKPLPFTIGKTNIKPMPSSMMWLFGSLWFLGPWFRQPKSCRLLGPNPHSDGSKAATTSKAKFAHSEAVGEDKHAGLREMGKHWAPRNETYHVDICWSDMKTVVWCCFWNIFGVLSAWLRKEKTILNMFEIWKDLGQIPGLLFGIRSGKNRSTRLRHCAPTFECQEVTLMPKGLLRQGASYTYVEQAAHEAFTMAVPRSTTPAAGAKQGMAVKHQAWFAQGRWQSNTVCHLCRKPMPDMPELRCTDLRALLLQQLPRCPETWLWKLRNWPERCLTLSMWKVGLIITASSAQNGRIHIKPLFSRLEPSNNSTNWTVFFWTQEFGYVMLKQKWYENQTSITMATLIYQHPNRLGVQRGLGATVCPTFGALDFPLVGHRGIHIFGVEFFRAPPQPCEVRENDAKTLTWFP